MAYNKSPIFALPLVGCASVGSANTNRSVSGITGLTLLVAAPAEGGLVEAIRVKATSTTTAGMIRVWHRIGGTGDAKLRDEIEVAAVTASASVAAFETTEPYEDFVLGANDEVYISTEKAESFNVFSGAGKYA